MFDLITLLCALRLLHHTSHINVSGELFASLHALFDRLYKALEDEIDTLMEKLAGLGKGIDPAAIAKGEARWLAKWTDEEFDCPCEAACRHGLKAETDLQKAIGSLCQSPAVKGAIGLDNYLRGLADAHDFAFYALTRQVAGYEKKEE